MPGSASLFTLPRGSITFDHVLDFCSQKIPEGTQVEYKETFREDVVEAMAAMANTDGGLIIVGVPCQEDRQTGQKLPDTPTGFEPKGDPVQQILNWCHVYLQPQWCPDDEIFLFPVPGDPSKVVMLIRVNRDQVPKVPVFHRRRGLLIRLGEQNRPADPHQTRELLQEAERTGQEELASFLQGKLPNLTSFCWCTAGLVLPRRRFNSRHWETAQITQLSQAVEEHRVGSTRVWLLRWAPVVGAKSDDPMALWRQKRSRQLIYQMCASLGCHRYDDGVHFFPIPLSESGPIEVREPDACLGE
ncbi:MAG: ATP-binding protein, partial [Bacillota bacterium]